MAYSSIIWAKYRAKWRPNNKASGKAKFVWDESQKKAFKELKHCLWLTLVLSLRDLQQLFKIEINSLKYAVGVVLTQHGHPMAYHRETLSDVVHKYPTYHKDMYSIVQAY